MATWAPRRLRAATGRRTLVHLGAVVAATLGLAACADVTVATRDLDATDLRLIAEATQDTLEKNKIGESANWSNPATGDIGTITPTRTFTQDNRPCRDFQQTATIDGRTRFAYDIACRNADGSWYSVSRESLADAIRYGSSSYARAYDRYYDPYYRDPFYDPWCRFPYRDRWCGPRSGFSMGFGSRF